MTRSARVVWLPVAVVAALALAAGAVFARADNKPDSPAQLLADESPAASPDASAEGVSAQNVDRIVGLLEDAGIDTDAPAFTTLAADLGVGGAVRALAWADATEGDTTAEEIVAMRADGMGWGVIRKELDPDGEFGLHPGIGWIMRGASPSPDASPAAATDTTTASEATGHGQGKGHGKIKAGKPGKP